MLIVSGLDQPGITAQVTTWIAQLNLKLLDLAQSRVAGQLNLALLIEKDREQLKAQAAPLESWIKEQGLELDIRSVASSTHGAQPSGDWILTLLGSPLSPNAIAAVTRLLADKKINIDRLEKLSHQSLDCLEIEISTLEAPTLRQGLARVGSLYHFDVALQRNSLYRRSKRLAVFDMDSTLIQNEVIDELAREKGCLTKVAEITERAMRGEIDYTQSLNERCALLQGLDASSLERVWNRITLTPGVDTLFKTLKTLGIQTAIVSGGFSFFADRLGHKLGADWTFANDLEVDPSGKLSGQVKPPIIDASAKSERLETLAHKMGIHLDQVIAVGDGANDIPMLEAAGLGVAFRAKPKVQERADTALNQTLHLASLLYLLGVPEVEWQKASAKP